MTATASSTATKHAHAATVAILLGHATKGQLRYAHKPGETTQVVLSRWKGKADTGKDTPKAHLSLDVFGIRFDNETLGPRGSIPFLFCLGLVVIIIIDTVSSNIEKNKTQMGYG